MTLNRFPEEQIVGVLKVAEAGTSMDDLCRRRPYSPQGARTTVRTRQIWRSREGSPPQPADQKSAALSN